MDPRSARGDSVGINDINCHLLLEESKGQGVLLE